MNPTLLWTLIALLLSAPVVQGQNPSFNEILADPLRSFSALVYAFEVANIDITTDVNITLTLFAPNDDAFEKMDPELLVHLLSDGWDAHLLDFLAMHMLPEARDFVSFTDGESVMAVNGESITVSLTTTPRTLKLTSPNTVGAVVTLPRNASSDGVFYEINDVLLPEFVTIDVLTVASAPKFSIFLELLVFSGLADLFLEGVVATVFAPMDTAFNALDADVLNYYRSNKTATAFLMLGHVIPDKVVSTIPIEDGPMDFISGAMETLSFVGTRGGNGYSFTINEANLVSPNVLTLDGIVHVIDAVLEVAGANAPVPSPVASPTVLVPPTRAPRRMMMMGGAQQGMRMMNMRKRKGIKKKLA